MRCWGEFILSVLYFSMIHDTNFPPRHQDDIGATLDDIYTTLDDTFFHMKMLSGQQRAAHPFYHAIHLLDLILEERRHAVMIAGAGILLPPAINVWYMIIMRTFFQGIPEELHESAYIDGANDLVIFGRIILPLSKAVLATMVVFYAVWHWNSFFPELVYLDDRMLYPMQLILRNMLLESDTGSATVSSDVAVMGRNIKYAAVFITVLPILVVYPFAQKYFVKGVMVGSVKG